MKIISTHNFKHTLKDIHDKSDDRKFCFILGAGASKSSGIPMGGDLAKKWFEEISNRTTKDELASWMNEFNIDASNLAPRYGSIYRKRFETDKTSGYEYLVSVMKDAKPSFGHIVLAQILRVSRGHCILTTNFDSLIESAIFQFTDETPLVCGHESLSGYAKASKIHPLIVKIHRDLLMAPKSLPSEIDSIDTGWIEPLNKIFSTHIPIIIGYGGNDGSLMTYFQNMKKPSNFFWCGMNENNVSEDISNLVEKMDGSYVKIDGFDELMHELLMVFSDIGPVEEELKKSSKGRIDRFNKQLREITQKQQHIDDISEDISNYEKELSALEYYNKAMAEMDYDKREAVFIEATEKYPNASWLWSNFIYFLQFIKRDYTNLDEYYQKALTVDPNEFSLNGNYAVYLNEIKKDPSKAEGYYLKTMELDQENAVSISNYALFLDIVYQKYEEAEKLHLQAIDLEPKNPIVLGAYADYLFHIKKDYTAAEEYFLKSLEFNNQNASNLANYATLLKNIKQDYKEAEKIFKKALNIDASDPSANSSYASFITQKQTDYNKAETYFLKAIEYAPSKENHMVNYAQLLFITDQHEKALAQLNEAEELNNERKNDVALEIWFYRFAHAYQNYKDQAIIQMNLILEEDVRSEGWDFSKNIDVAVALGHPDVKLVKSYAQAITTPK